MKKPSESKTNARTTGLRRVLGRVDQLPIIDGRTPEEIIGYDGNGLPSHSTTCQPASSQNTANEPDMEEWRRSFGRSIPQDVKDFLEYRHREWELSSQSEPPRARRQGNRKPLLRQPPKC